MTARRTWFLALIPLALLSSCTSTATHQARTAAAVGPPATVRPVPAHVAALTAALARMRQVHAFQTSPGMADISDYDVADLWLAGIDGTGTTIALIEGWNDPQIDHDMAAFDQSLGLPTADIRTVYPTGTGRLPARCPPAMDALGDYGSCDAWANELLLDVETAHVIAPYAKILIAVAPPDSEITDDAASQVAPPEMMRAVEYVSTHHLADSISISDNTGESTYGYGKPEITAQDPAELTAAAEGIPVAVGTGDCGVVQNRPSASAQCGDTTTTRDTATWDDSPWVTAVGGGVPDIDPTSGQRLGPDTVWQDGRTAEGAGFSSIYARPAYQDQVATATHGTTRSVPDITMDGQNGTSEATPMFAAVLALAAQLDHGPVGPVNDALYRTLGPQGMRGGIVDMVSGSNSVSEAVGFPAATGFDVATGWGTINADTFVPALVAAVRAQQGPATPRRRAATALAALQHAVHLSRTDIPAGGSADLVAGGFLPRHPVALAVDGRRVATLTANTGGTVGHTLTPTALAIAPGPHTLTLTGMLLTETATFRSS